MQTADVKLWHVYYVERCHYVRPAPKPKFVVTVGYNSPDHFWAFLINSAIRPFIQNRPSLLQCEAVIIAEQHRFLRHNSYIDCTNLYSFYARDFQSTRGAITADAMKRLLEAVRRCPMLKQKHKNMILVNGSEYLDSI